jgi:hypothetical protein
MGTGYTRNDTANNIADGNVINASDLDGEFDAVQAAFNASTGHAHDGTTGEGPQIQTAGLADDAVTGDKIDSTTTVTAASFVGPLTGNVGGNLTGDVTGNVTGNLTGDVLAADGTSVFDNGTDGTDAVFTGSVTGDITGNVTGDILAADGTSVFDNGTDGTDAVFTGSVTGNASTATTFETARTIAGVSFDGSADITLASTDLTDVTAEASQINLLDGSLAGTVVNEKAAIYSAAGDLAATTITLGTTAITATGDELNHVSGVTSAIQTQLDAMVEKAGDTLTGNLNFGNGIQASFGASSELNIYHEASGDSFIADNGTGDLILSTDGSAVKIRSNSNTTDAAVFTQDGAVELYYANGKKLETTTSGVSITGTLDATTLSIGSAPITATASEINYLDITTLGTSEASKVLTADSSGAISITGEVKVQHIKEKVNVSATASTGTINLDALTQQVTYYTTDATANWTLNVRGDSSNTLNSIMSTGESLTVVFIAEQGTTAYYASAFQVDGSAVTPKWQGGSAPSEGTASSADSYSLTVVKTADAAFTVFASLTSFA